MAQTGFTPILLYSSSTGGNTPAAGSLTNNTVGSELAINITDGKLFYKDNANAVQVIGWKTTPTTAGGTGLTSYTAGDLPYYATGTTLSKLGIGSNGQILTSTGTAPQWSTLSGVAVTTFSAGTTGFTPSSATSGAVTLAGTLATTNGGTGLTSFTSGGILYASSTSALTTGSALTYDGTTLKNTGTVGSVLAYIYPTTQTTSAIQSILKIGGHSSNTARAVQIACINGASNDVNQMAFYYGYASTIYEGMRLIGDNVSGKLGINNTSPGDVLTVSLGNIRVDENYYIQWGGTANGIQGNNTNNYLLFRVAAAEIARFTSTGLGIGTNVQAARIHASQSYSTPANGISADTTGIVSKSNTANGNCNFSILSRSSGEARLYFGNQYFEDSASIIYKASGALTFSNSIPSDAPAQRMQIGPTGGVSIGNTTDPGATNLSVTGTVAAAKGVVGIPAFRAYLASNQSPTAGVLTKVAFASTTFDTASAFDTTNNRFKPTVAGYYQLNAEMDLGGSVSYAVTFYKNGSLYDSGQWWLSAAASEAYLAASCLIYLNGSTDYVEVYARAGATATFYGSAGGTYSIFSGVMVRGA